MKHTVKTLIIASVAALSFNTAAQAATSLPVVSTVYVQDDAQLVEANFSKFKKFKKFGHSSFVKKKKFSTKKKFVSPKFKKKAFLKKKF